jgi:opacity protein-like surface antigen
VIAFRIVFLCFLPTLALAQSPPTPTDPSPTTTTPQSTPRHHNDPVPAARAPVFGRRDPKVTASVGYAFTNLSMPSSNRVNLSGVDAAVTADLSTRLGVTANPSYVRASNVLDTGQHVDVLSYLVGPVFYPARRGRLATYAHALVGGARVSGVIPFNGTGNETGYVNKWSWAIGGGIEYQVSRSVALRSGGDYQHTYFYNLNSAIRGQNDFRVVSSVVYTLWQHPERSR